MNDELTSDEVNYFIEQLLPHLQGVEVDHNFVLVNYDNGRGHLSEVIYDYQAE